MSEKKVTVSARVAWLLYAVVARLNAYYQIVKGQTWGASEWMADFVKPVMKVVGKGYPWIELDEKDDFEYAHDYERDAVFEKHKRQGDGNPANTFTMEEWVLEELNGPILDDINSQYYPDGDGSVRLGKVMYLVAKYYAENSDDYKEAGHLVEKARAAKDEADAEATASE